MHNGWRLPGALFLTMMSALLLSVWLAGEPVASWLAREDGPIENLQVLFYLMGALACAFTLKGRRHMAWASFWLLLCIASLGEETSWFQRVFGYHVPWVEQASSQHEFNLHNFELFGEGRLIEPSGEFDISLDALLNSQNLFRIGFVGWFLLLPLLTLLPALRSVAARFDYVRPDSKFLFAMWAALAFAAALTLTTVPPVKDYVAEVTELGYAAAMFAYTLMLGKAAPQFMAMPGAVRRLSRFA